MRSCELCFQDNKAGFLACEACMSLRPGVEENTRELIKNLQQPLPPAVQPQSRQPPSTTISPPPPPSLSSSFSSVAADQRKQKQQQHQQHHHALWQAGKHNDETEYGGWRWVRWPGSEPIINSSPSDQQVERWKSELRAMIATHVKSSRPALTAKIEDKVKEFAAKSGLVVGKWMLFEQSHPGSDFVALWGRVKRGVLEGRLGSVAKFATGSPDKRVIIVYTKSFLDKEDVERVRKELVQLGGNVSSWKADIMTYLGIYASNNNADPSKIVVSGLRMGWFSGRGEQEASGEKEETKDVSWSRKRRKLLSELDA